MKFTVRICSTLSVFIGFSVFLCLPAGLSAEQLLVPVRASIPSTGADLKEHELYLPKYSFPQAGSLSATADLESYAGNIKNWDYLFSRLASYGVDPEYLSELFSDKRMGKRRPLYFKLKPRESGYFYRRHNTRRRRRNALRFYAEHQDSFREASARFGVPEEIILAIMQIETQCGSNTGRNRVFYRLARLAAAATPENVETNYKKTRRRNRSVTRAQVQKRAQWLEDTFLPHMFATIVVAQQMSIHPLELRGSAAGAIGMTQFLPGNVVFYGADGDRDGTVDIFSPADAIFSTANFLREKGWQSEGMSRKDQENVIWHYNHSKPYIKTVLAMARALTKSL